MLSRLKAGWFAGRRRRVMLFRTQGMHFLFWGSMTWITFSSACFLLISLREYRFLHFFFSAMLFSSTRCNGLLSFTRLVAAPDSRSCPLFQLLQNESRTTGCLACLEAGRRWIASQGQKLCKSALRLFYTKSREVFIFKAHFGTEGYDWLITERTHPYERN